MNNYFDKNRIKTVAAYVFLTAGCLLFLNFLNLNEHNKELNTSGKVKGNIRQYESPDSTYDYKVNILYTKQGFDADSLYKERYPDSIKIKVPEEFAGRIDAFGACYKVLLGPKNWTGRGQYGADNNIFVFLYPQDGSEWQGSRIIYSKMIDCLGCILKEAAPFFKSAMDEYNATFNPDGYEPVKIPKELKITKLSKTLVRYSFLNRESLTVHGVIYYSSNGEDHEPMIEAECAFADKDSVLSDYLLKTFIEKDSLK